MNPTIKNNALTWAVVLLIIANIVVITLFWIAHHRQQLHPHETPAEFLAKELGLDEKQKDQLHQLASQHHMESEKIKEHIKEARDHFFDLLKLPNVSDTAKNTSANAISENLKALELLTFDHFQKVRMICTPDQQIKFDKIIDEVLKMVAGPPPGPPPGGPSPGRRGGPPGDLPPRDTP